MNTEKTIKLYTYPEWQRIYRKRKAQKRKARKNQVIKLLQKATGFFLLVFAFFIPFIYKMELITYILAILSWVVVACLLVAATLLIGGYGFVLLFK